MYFVYLCLGTGIGSGVVLNNKLLEPKRYEGFEFEYNGHSYIEFRRYTGNSYYRIGTVHNPDCKCNNDK